MHLVSRGHEGRAFIGGDVVGEEVAPGVVGHVLDVGERASRYICRVGYGANVTGFAEVVPGYDSALC